jgi:hypothetical protein
MIFDIRFDAKKGLWTPWVEAGVRSMIPKTATYNSIVVPTVDTVRHEWLMNELLVNNFHVLCTGDTVIYIMLNPYITSAFSHSLLYLFCFSVLCCVFILTTRNVVNGFN